MIRAFYVTFAALLLAVAPLSSAEISGKYVEARDCDVWTGPCFANAEINIAGKDGIMAWHIDKGSVGDVSLDGLGVVAVVSASDTLGARQTGPARAVFIVDRRATPQQQQALIHFAQKQGGKLLANVVTVQRSDVSVELCDCKGQTCAEVSAGGARIKTRCLHHKHDVACGNETAYYPPLAGGVRAKAAVARHSFAGLGLGHTWREEERRGAYVGTFSVR